MISSARLVPEKQVLFVFEVLPPSKDTKYRQILTFPSTHRRFPAKVGLILVMWDIWMKLGELDFVVIVEFTLIVTIQIFVYYWAIERDYQ